MHANVRAALLLLGEALENHCPGAHAKVVGPDGLPLWAWPDRGQDPLLPSAEEIAFARAGKPIEAIKHARLRIGCGLMEAKNLYERWAAGGLL